MRQIGLAFVLLALICNVSACGPSGSSKGGNGTGATAEGSVSGGTAEGTTDGSTTSGSSDGTTTDGTTDGTAGTTTDGTTDGTAGSGSSDGSATSGTDPGTTDGSATDGTTDGSATDGTTDGTEEPPAISVCVQECSSSADCAIGEIPAFSGDNYNCVEGACVYIGCNSDSECDQSYPRMNYGCASNGIAMDICTKKCASAQDCDLGTEAYSADNHKCEGGYCIFTGCISDDECTESLQNVDYVCKQVISNYPAHCVIGCSTASDCDLGSAAYSTNNYACKGGACHYIGCNSDNECAETYQNSVYICH